jgi:hypothetical protein
LKNVQFCSRPRKAKILTTGIHGVISRMALKLHFVQNVEPDAGMGQKGAFSKGLKVNKGD